MRLLGTCLWTIAVSIFASGSVRADTTLPSESIVWECPQPDGISIYTNRERPGCQAMSLRPLSVVPSLPPLAGPPAPLSPDAALSAPTDVARQIPDWGKEWYANIAPSRAAHEEVCALYSEWLHLNERTRGGFFFGTDPSFGSDPSGYHRRGPSYSFYDNARWVALAKIFGTGFVPVGCP
jgi:hypothetical protein